MSSLAAARADNFYYPPDWSPGKGSLNKFQNSHGALGQRAKKLDQGILVIRFEMPFNVWCSGCNHLIGKGVRFNAEKKQIGTYHSTKIWSFIMHAPCCKQLIEVHTDPKNAEYVVVSGARRKVETFDSKEAGTVELDPTTTSAKLADPLARLEHENEDARRAVERRSDLVTLKDDSDVRHKDDYEMNKRLRSQMRVARKDEKAREEKRKDLGLPEHIKLLPASKTDALRASAVQYGGKDKFAQNWKHARRKIASSSIFSPSAVAAATGKKRGPSNSSAAVLQHKKQRVDIKVKLGLANNKSAGDTLLY